MASRRIDGDGRPAGPSTARTDRLDRPLRDLRISVTDRCNFRCVYCMPKEIFGRDYAFLDRDELLSFEEITRIATVAAAHGVRAQVEWTVLYPVTVNDQAEAAFTGQTLSRMFGERNVVKTDDPLMGSEDFSFVLEEIPGCFVFLQCSPPEVDVSVADWNHSAKVLFDDAVLPTQAAALAGLAWERLARG